MSKIVRAEVYVAGNLDEAIKIFKSRVDQEGFLQRIKGNKRRHTDPRRGQRSRRNQANNGVDTL